MDDKSENAKNFLNDLDLIKSAAVQGGEIALEYFNSKPKVSYKENNSPVSEADLAVNQKLSELLRNARPDYGWLSEETEDSDDRLACDSVFVIDPIDGTKEFLKETDIWTICIAIVSDSRPTMASIYNPVRKELYSAEAGQGAWLGDRKLDLGSQPKQTERQLSAPKRVRKHAYWQKNGFTETIYIGSLAYRLAMVGSGQLDALVIRQAAHDWDIAAADLIIEEAGGLLTDINGNIIQYNQTETKHPPLVAAHQKLHKKVLTGAKLIFDEY